VLLEELDDLGVSVVEGFGGAGVGELRVGQHPRFMSRNRGG
jgi:hypothetical protein